MKKYYLIISFCMLSFNMMAQKISGVVKDENGTAFKGITVSLIREKDSVAVKYTATKADGQYQFEGLESGK